MAENHALRIQYTILGTMILRPECVGEAAERLQITDFDTEGTRALFAAVVRLHMDGAPIDPITVEQAAGEDLEPLIRAGFAPVVVVERDPTVRPWRWGGCAGTRLPLAPLCHPPPVVFPGFHCAVCGGHPAAVLPA